MLTDSLSRRDFLRLTCATGAVLLAPSLLNGATNSAAALTGTKKLVDAEQAAEAVLAKAREAVATGSRGVGGLIMENSTGRVIREGFNHRFRPVNADVATIPGQTLTWDYTAHGETSLVGWYQLNRERLNLPPAHKLTIVTTLDPCAMCTGSIMTAGFNSAVVAFDPTGGMNLDMTGSYDTLPKKLRKEAQATFGFYGVTDTRPYQGPNQIPFRKTSVSYETAKGCADVFFVEGANYRDYNLFDNVPVADIQDPRSLPKSNPMRVALAKVSKAAFAIRLDEPKSPNTQLRKYLTNVMKATPGALNAVGFVDPFGNLLFAAPDTPSRGSIATAFMNATQAYARTRFRLFNNAETHSVAMNTLTAARHGMFVWLYAPTPGLTTTVKDLGAYGSSVGTKSPGTFQFYRDPRQGTMDQLRRQIAIMPPYYSVDVAIDPVRIEV